ncbi:MAG: hypothetical protein K2X49_20050 [Acetobacteraceae bacterium]|nr:hypothetical protein [Acetobacteraceae bacterium]
MPSAWRAPLVVAGARLRELAETLEVRVAAAIAEREAAEEALRHAHNTNAPSC